MAKKEIIVISQEPLANCDRFSGGEVENRIFTIRGVQVILDRDLAELYGVKTYRLNEQVKRNIKRFPERYRFQLTEEETNELIANCDRFETLKHSSFCPYAFTEHGVVMLSAVLHSEEAIDISAWPRMHLYSNAWNILSTSFLKTIISLTRFSPNWKKKHWNPSRVSSSMVRYSTHTNSSVI